MGLGLSPGGGAGLPYKTWHGLLSQAGTNPPTAAVKINDLGGTIIWTRVRAGLYEATLFAAFPAARTFLCFPSALGYTGDGFGNMSRSPLLLYALRVSDDVFWVQTGIDGGPGTEIDDLLDNTLFEIRVYPV